MDQNTHITKLQRLGLSSLYVLIPQEFAHKMQVEKGQYVKIVFNEFTHTIIIEKMN